MCSAWGKEKRKKSNGNVIRVLFDLLQEGIARAAEAPRLDPNALRKCNMDLQVLGLEISVSPVSVERLLCLFLLQTKKVRSPDSVESVSPISVE